MKVGVFSCNPCHSHFLRFWTVIIQRIMENRSRKTRFISLVNFLFPPGSQTVWIWIFFISNSICLLMHCISKHKLKVYNTQQCIILGLILTWEKPRQKYSQMLLETRVKASLACINITSYTCVLFWDAESCPEILQHKPN